MKLYVAARVGVELHGGAGAVAAAGHQGAAAVPEYVTDDPVLLQLTLDLLLSRGVGSPLSTARPGRQHRLLNAWAEVVSAGAGR